MKSQPPLSKVEMIDRSLRCFALGLLGLVPVIGVTFAVRALLHARRVKLGRGTLWNPAQRYLLWGGICARLGIALTLILGLTIGSVAYLS